VTRKRWGFENWSRGDHGKRKRRGLKVEGLKVEGRRSIEKRKR
jgi:hypothetical protein